MSTVLLTQDAVDNFKSSSAGPVAIVKVTVGRIIRLKLNSHSNAGGHRISMFSVLVNDAKQLH